jgi:hypothetical protein
MGAAAKDFSPSRKAAQPMLTRQFSRIHLWLGLTLPVLALAVAGSALVPQARAAEALLPNLVADPPAGISLETSTTEGGLKKEVPPQLLLRFNGYIHNLGPGPVDFRGSRSSSNEAMKAFQRVYSSDGSFKEEPSAAELVYSSADGHEHWHLQRAAKYSLWNLAKSAEVAPAMKVGFCLDDSEHVEPGVGPSEKVYADSTGREFCRQHQPEATSLFEGISAGWRDLYSSNLAFQWVDASSVLPGEYFLREDVNTTGAIKETGGANTPAYTTSPVIIPGFNALPAQFGTAAGGAHTVTLTSKAFKDAATPTYKIVSGPAHGTLGAVSKNQVTYTPAAGYSGPDSFTFAASDPSSPFPRSPAVATVSIGVNAPPPAPGIAIATAPSTLVAGTSGPLSAVVSNDTGGVEWSATEGATVAPEGTEGLTASLKAPGEPPAAGTVTVTASLRDDPEVRAQATVAVALVPPVIAAPTPPLAPSPSPPSGSGGVQGFQAHAAVRRPQVVLLGRRLVMSTLATVAGRVRLSAYLGRHRLGTCVTVTPPDRSFTCRLTLATRFSIHAPIKVLASLRHGTLLVRSVRPAAPVKQMKMAGHVLNAIAASASWQFWCEPSALPRALAQRASAQG